MTWFLLCLCKIVIEDGDNQEACYKRHGEKTVEIIFVYYGMLLQIMIFFSEFLQSVWDICHL